MRKLSAPTNDPMDVYAICVSAVGDNVLRQFYNFAQSQMEEAVAAFNLATASVSWAHLQRVPRGNPNVPIFNNLTKKHLTDLYTTYMVGATGDSRKIYDTLLVASGGLCPLCGGLGHVYTLDHYLPKSNFPAYSILPKNLIPCCRDCNTGKNSNFGAHVHEQTLHPYLDEDKFFGQRWLSAEVSKTNPIEISFKCAPPFDWSATDKLRVKQHFINYKIGYRFRVQAGAELARLIDLRSNSLRNLPATDFRAFLLESANSNGFDLNGWNRTMYAALAEAAWFSQCDFTDPNWHFYS